MCIGIIWNNSSLVGGRARAEARIDPRSLRTSRSTAHGAQVVWPLDYMGRAELGKVWDKSTVSPFPDMVYIYVNETVCSNMLRQYDLPSTLDDLIHIKVAPKRFPGAQVILKRT